MLKDFVLDIKLTTGWGLVLSTARVVKALINVVGHSRLGASDATTDTSGEERDTLAPETDSVWQA